ncbi:septum formation initiator family protein [Pseudoruegeria sp. SK021]|uniref:FtsB family cell division protein n=1 Tax=Pseudoruegeria sp. SK021 TaxID=1933035 RepID=UPI000A2543B6|nr:septum formation initiator family protein [Pseudoruegeria sp. SK021]OSP54332.1 septum formation initiator precursor [Pseudoruegeria sp. SK021]
MTKNSGFGFLAYATMAVALAIYFAFAAVQGDLGVLQRIAIQSELNALIETRDALEGDVAAMTNKTRRLSDNFLDLDLLDERARNILGTLRADDLVVR